MVGGFKGTEIPKAQMNFRAALFFVLRVLLMIWAVSSLLFLLMHAMPGDASYYYFSPDSPSNIQQQMRENLGLDRPLWIQYFSWLWQTLQLDFQNSLISHRPVLEMVLESLPRTVFLGIVSLGGIFLLGVPVGVFAARREGSFADRLLSATSLVFYSMPAFALGILLILVFAYSLPWFPISGTASVNAQDWPFWKQMLDRLWHLCLPAATLILGNIALVIRHTRAGVLQAFEEDFVRSARAKGVPENQVFYRHALRRALVPMVTLLGLSLPFLVSGAVLVEQVFGWHGMGFLLVDSIFTRDYPVVLGCCFFLTSFVVLGNALADKLLLLVDPRVKAV